MMRLLYKGFVLLKSPIKGIEFCCCVKSFHRSSGPARQTHYEDHYEVLGVDREATKEQIKAAYLKLGKEFHPDKLRLSEDRKNMTKLQRVRKAEEDHVHFVKINLAYSVLSKPQSRREYDLGLAGKQDPLSYDYGPKGADGKQQTTTRYYQARTFDERAMHYGYRANPNFKYDNSIYWVAAGCIVFAIVGYIIHYKIAYLAFEQQRDFLDKRHVQSTNDLKKVEEFRGSFESREANLEYWAKNLKEVQEQQKARLQSLREEQEKKSWLNTFVPSYKIFKDETDDKK